MFILKLIEIIEDIIDNWGKEKKKGPSTLKEDAVFLVVITVLIALMLLLDRVF